jgi:hypothetical protein
MSLKRWDAKRDANEPDVIRALRRVGAQVVRLDVFDLLVLFRGQPYLIDIKSEHGKPTRAQRTLVALGWPLRFVQTPEEALAVIGALR